LKRWRPRKLAMARPSCCATTAISRMGDLQARA
jgi:hypothetical protein